MAAEVSWNNRVRSSSELADFEGARMMYNAGWDPKAQIELMTRISKLSLVERGGHLVFYSTHPDDPDRIASDEKEIDKLPPKAELIEDSPRFQETEKEALAAIALDMNFWRP